MNCPQCNTPNDPSNRFCVKCGQPLDEVRAVQPANAANGAYATPLARSAPELLGILTLQLLLALVGLWLLRLVLNGLPFVRELSIPDLNVPMTVLVNTLVYLVAIGLLVGFTRTLWALWPQAYPDYADAAPVLVSLVYLAVLVCLYYAARPLIARFSTEPLVLTVFQVALLLIAVFLLLTACLTAYRGLRGWLVHLRQGLSAPPSAQVACLNCGRINSAGMEFCGSCGASLPQEARPALARSS